ncbi:MAG: hypothetical protein JO318_06995 [Chloroflexi bacterium]|nr:hypothetical protein [Chloroflexota bacterium]
MVFLFVAGPASGSGCLLPTTDPTASVDRKPFSSQLRLFGCSLRMRRLPKPIMIGLAQAIMIACVAALGTPLRGEGLRPTPLRGEGLRPFTPRA